MSAKEHSTTTNLCPQRYTFCNDAKPMGLEAVSFADYGLAYDLPDHALRALDVLEQAGFEAWVVGGWVRDALRGAPSHDVDITTSARWQETKAVLESAGITVHETGTAHGTVTAVVDGEPIEITTYRMEGAYSDHRHPDEVHFVRDVKEDLARRDFTVNALAYHPVRGLLDLFGGALDLERGIIRAVGDPRQRFAEDALRVLRAVRFAARMGFRVEDDTHRALVEAAPGLADIAQERIGQEMDGIVRSGRLAWALLAETEVMCAAIPELLPMVGFDQRSVWHAYDVYEHTVRVCRASEEFTGGCASAELRWAALLHDVAKPATFTLDPAGRGHFFGHPKVGAKMAQEILHRLALPKPYIARICTLIRFHDHVMHPTTRSIRRTLVKLEQACPGDACALVYQLIDLKRCDAVSKVPRAALYVRDLDVITSAVRQELRNKPPLRVTDLAVNGWDIIDTLCIAPGPAVRRVQEELLFSVINGEVENDREVLLGQLRGAGRVPQALR